MDKQQKLSMEDLRFLLSSWVSINKGYLNICMTMIVLLLLIIVILVVLDVYLRKMNQTLRVGYAELDGKNGEMSVQVKDLIKSCSELKKKNEKLHEQAYSDGLTNLPNKTALLERIDSSLATMRKEEKFVLMHIDLDNFKIVNDTFGHAHGDELILDVSHRIKEAIDKENDLLARGDSDEFLIFSQNIKDLGEYEEKIKRIQKVFSYPFDLKGKKIFITMSIGVAVAPNDARTSQTLMMNVDLAMYEAKAIGKNTYCYFSTELGEKYSKKLQVQSEMTKALENNEFEVYYQSIVNLNSNDTVGYEALVRWKHPERGLLRPKDFIDVAIETGQIISIGKIVIEDVCKQLRDWKKSEEGIYVVSINLSKRQFFDKDLVDLIKENLEKYNLEGRMLEIEVKETVITDDIDEASEVVTRLRELGIRIVIDNFGSNCSSINCLKTLPISKIKIDKTYLDSAMSEECDRVTIASLISIADSRGITCVVEGVEYGEQIEFLKRVNCRNVQGYLFGQPEPKCIELKIS